MMKWLLFLILVGFSVPVLAQSQNPLSSSRNSSEPIEISADQTLEWHRNDLQFIARGNAKATQGTVSVTGETLTADYKSTQKSNIDIWQLTSEQNVQIQDGESTAYGDKAVYNVTTGVATLTGQNLKLVSPEQTITATQKFVYKTNESKALAIGNAKVVRPTDTLEADRIEAVFHENGGEGQNAVKTLEAKINVVITTEKEVLTGDYAIYKSATNTAEISGNVKITSGANVLEGAKAEVDLTTNISKMFGAQATGKRVRGVFYPKSADKAASSVTEDSNLNNNPSR